MPPPDKKADAIGVFDVRQNKLVRLIPAGSDPEEFDLSKDGTLLYCSNEDVGQTSIVDIATGKVIASIPVGPEPEGVTTSPDGKIVFVTSEQGGTDRGHRHGRSQDDQDHSCWESPERCRVFSGRFQSLRHAGE